MRFAKDLFPRPRVFIPFPPPRSLSLSLARRRRRLARVAHSPGAHTISMSVLNPRSSPRTRYASAISIHDSSGASSACSAVAQSSASAGNRSRSITTHSVGSLSNRTHTSRRAISPAGRTRARVCRRAGGSFHFSSLFSSSEGGLIDRS